MSSVKFITIAVSDNEESFLFESLEKKRRTDEDWIKTFLLFLIESYYTMIIKNINFRDKDERFLKVQIYNHYKNSFDHSSNFTLVREPQTDNTDRIGYYDLKFQDTTWDNNQKYFAVEAKCLDGNSNSIKEYIHNTKKKKGIEFTDGGVYRFLSLKYSEDMVYGGMLGFIQKGNSKDTLEKIKDNLNNLELKIDGCEKFGKNLDRKLFEEKIEDFENSFLSEHERCFQGKKEKKIKLYHLFYDFADK